MARDSFKETFKCRDPDPEDMQKVLEAIKKSDRVLSEEQAEQIHDNIMELDPSAAVEALKMYKAPGPDGIPNEFYYQLKGNEDLGYLLSGVYTAMIETGEIPASMRETYYRLLYKKERFSAKDIRAGTRGDEPHLLTNWRPIGLLCCDYKILYATLANVIKPHLDSVVSKMQNAFVPGRNIQNNVLLAKLMQHHHQVNNIPAGMLFIDFAHAYDFVSQDYIISVLETMQFPPVFIRLVALSMKDQYGRVIVNGDLTDKFPIRNGGKQGDPLFPYMYVLALEGLFAYMEQGTDIQGVKLPQHDEWVQHMGYADDTAVLIGPNDDIGELEEALDVFCRASGHQLKPRKSNLLWLGPWRRSRKRMEVAGIKPAKKGDAFKYLGFFLGHDVTDDAQWEMVLNMINLAAVAWRARGCTLIGRTEVLNAVLASKLWYYVAMMPIRPKFLKQIMAKINWYFRQGKKTTSVSQELRSTPKVKGGLGQIDIAKQIESLHISMVTKALANPNQPWASYWLDACYALSKHCKAGFTDATVLDTDWKKLRATKKNSLSPLVVAAYKA